MVEDDDEETKFGHAANVAMVEDMMGDIVQWMLLLPALRMEKRELTTEIESLALDTTMMVSSFDVYYNMEQMENAMPKLAERFIKIEAVMESILDREP